MEKFNFASFNSMAILRLHVNSRYKRESTFLMEDIVKIILFWNQHSFIATFSFQLKNPLALLPLPAHFTKCKKRKGKWLWKYIDSSTSKRLNLSLVILPVSQDHKASISPTSYEKRLANRSLPHVQNSAARAIFYSFNNPRQSWKQKQGLVY